MLAAAVLIACREMGSLRTIKDIAAALSIPRKDISRNYSVLIFELGIKVPLVDPIKCVARVANALNVNEKIKHRAFNMMTEIVETKKALLKIAAEHTLKDGKERSLEDAVKILIDEHKVKQK